VSHRFMLTREISCTSAVSGRLALVSIPEGSVICFVGSAGPNRVEVSWHGQRVTMPAGDFAEGTKVRGRAVAALGARGVSRRSVGFGLKSPLFV
jgi:hypothetical protein